MEKRLLGARFANLDNRSSPDDPPGRALLGDRIRTLTAPDDHGVYFRSLSTRGTPGGMGVVARDAVPLLGACGFDCALIETIGVGHDDVAVREVADVLVLLLTPGTGDEVQWQKAGLIEVADILLVNTSDLPAPPTSPPNYAPSSPSAPVAPDRSPHLHKPNGHRNSKEQAVFHIVGTD